MRCVPRHFSSTTQRYLTTLKVTERYSEVLEHTLRSAQSHREVAMKEKIWAIKHLNFRLKQHPTLNWLPPAAATSSLFEQEFMSFLFISLLILTNMFLPERKMRWPSLPLCKVYKFFSQDLALYFRFLCIISDQTLDPQFLEEAEEEMGRWWVSGRRRLSSVNLPSRASRHLLTFKSC